MILEEDQDHHALLMFSLVWYKVGGSCESDGITGISYVLEYMIFRGTEKYPAGVFEKTISDLGAE